MARYMCNAPGYVHSMVFILLACGKDDIVYHNVSCEGNDRNSETGKHAPQHGGVREDGVPPPGVHFRPRVTKEWWLLGHLRTIGC
jgi:hypothetical protein